MQGVTRVRLALAVGIIVLLMLANGRHTGRYAVVPLNQTEFLLIDTATGERWLYGPNRKETMKALAIGEMYTVFEVKMHDEVPLVRRLSP
jgi:hypothetical protein